MISLFLFSIQSYLKYHTLFPSLFFLCPVPLTIPFVSLFPAPTLLPFLSNLSFSSCDHSLHPSVAFPYPPLLSTVPSFSFALTFSPLPFFLSPLPFLIPLCPLYLSRLPSLAFLPLDLLPHINLLSPFFPLHSLWPQSAFPLYSWTLSLSPLPSLSPPPLFPPCHPYLHSDEGVLDRHLLIERFVEKIVITANYGLQVIPGSVAEGKSHLSAGIK